MGTTLPSSRLPSTSSDFTPRHTPAGFLTSMLSLLPRKVRTALKPGQDLGMQGSMRSPSISGLIPRMCWVAVKCAQEAVPESHGMRERPNFFEVLAWVLWQWTYGSISRISARSFWADGMNAR